ncbi:MAG: bifunctional pyr operon transcriptional regulator/uracil phosphoribosyltransferase PyrR [Clostridia bacterium]|nr:bifunctional pyr operon transcriptional regulator/uracil phosphoribosyltransferase PyrR [Clostridia bacterium]
MAAAFEFKANIMDANAMERALRRVAHEIIENNHGVEGLTLVGIQRRGVTLARMLQELIERVEGVRLPLGVLDITFYRDDLSILQEHPVVNATDLPFQVHGAKIVMVDDVLFSGRTARAAMDAICDMGRPSLIQLAVMVDRGHRELPIRADYVGKNLPTSKSEMVGVHVPEYDGDMGVVLYEKR